MLIGEFVLGRNIEKQAVYRYLTRHKDLIEKCSKKGKELDIPDDVIKILDEKYPLAKPVEIINGVPEEEHRRVLEKLSQTQELLIRMQQELVESKSQLMDLKDEIGDMKLLETSKNTEISNLKDNLSYLQQEIDKMRNRTLWERIRNR